MAEVGICTVLKVCQMPTHETVRNLPLDYQSVLISYLEKELS